ncbi:MAG: deoxyribodipyrimidine photolyase, partial [Betaproteobacteria bacterium HGW-Betaproteobacteria-21]
MPYSVVWFKRDLRVHDHAALTAAAARGPVLCLYIVEPSLWAASDTARQHYHFILECLREVYRALREHGGRVHVVCGELTDVLTRLHAAAPFDALYAHEETGNDLSFQRDRAVARWCRSRGVQWQEFPQFGVVRRLRNRDEWQARWESHAAQPCLPVPATMRFAPLPWADTPPPDAAALGLTCAEPPLRQRGGRTLAVLTLEDFLNERSLQYRGGISSPLRAPSACSRLSPYLSFGCLSLRVVVQATRAQIVRLPPSATRHR